MFDFELDHIGESVGHYHNRTYHVTTLAFRCGCQCACGTVSHLSVCERHAPLFPNADFLNRDDGTWINLHERRDTCEEVSA